MIRRFLRYLAFRHGKAVGLYRRICRPNSREYADFLRTRGVLHSIGEGCYINLDVVFTDPLYVKIGNFCSLADCSLIGHDGSITVLSHDSGKILDKVGKIEIGDHCFIGHGAILLPDVVLGNRVIVAAGAVVTKSFGDGVVIGGVPARVLGTTDDYIDKLEKKTREYPWYETLKGRTDVFDQEAEKVLLAERLKHFFGPSRR